MRLRIISLLVISLCLLTVTEAAFAWGPATHIGLGRGILDNLGLLPPAIAAILGRRAISFLYGNIAADVVFAKRLSRVKQFCHHWSTAFRVAEDAKSEEELAFAYGYLAHLAADTVAHGRYIPHQIASSQTSVNFGHLYWELRADALQPSEILRLLRTVVHADHDRHHALLALHIKDTFLPYEMNRMLFDRMNALTLRRGFRRTVNTVNWLSRWPLSPTLLNGFLSDSLERIRSVLTEGEASPVLREDPSGTSALMQLRVHKRDVRRQRRRLAPVEGRVREVTSSLAPLLGSATGNLRPESRETITVATP